MKKTYIKPTTTVVKTELASALMDNSVHKDITDVIDPTPDQSGDYNSGDVLSKEWNASLLWDYSWDDEGEE